MQRAIFRIIDANFNRAREAVRVMEEFCRFGLNSARLTSRAKQFRHQLSAAIAQLDAEKLITSRDTAGDIGTDIKVAGQLQRDDLNTCFTAACKRLTEALRTLSETTQTLNPDVASTVEDLRYAAYTLEKDILTFSCAVEKFKPVRLYVIISSDLPVDIISLARSCADGGADCIQLRAKNMNDDEIFALAAELVKICKETDTISIINDRADIAVAAGADGVHLGQHDMPIAEGRKIQIWPLIFGKSTHSLGQLQKAVDEQADYAALGPVFATATKPEAGPVGLEYVTKAVELLEPTGISSVAIGGITLDNIEEVLRAGAKAVAVCSAVAQAVEPKDMCRRLKAKITAYQK